MATIDFSAVDPVSTADANDPEALLHAVQALKSWNERALASTDVILAQWISDCLARSQDREGWAELHGLVQRLQVLQPVKDQPEALRNDVAAHYGRWSGMADLLAARAHRQDYHNPEEIEGRAHMAELKNLLEGSSELPTKVIQEQLQLSPSRLSQLLSLAEAADLITRRKRGRERFVSASGRWQSSKPSNATIARHSPPGRSYLVDRKAA